MTGEKERMKEIWKKRRNKNEFTNFQKSNSNKMERTNILKRIGFQKLSIKIKTKPEKKKEH